MVILTAGYAQATLADDLVLHISLQDFRSSLKDGDLQFVSEGVFVTAWASVIISFLLFVKVMIFESLWLTTTLFVYFAILVLELICIFMYRLTVHDSLEDESTRLGTFLPNIEIVSFGPAAICLYVSPAVSLVGLLYTNYLVNGRIFYPFDCSRLSCPTFFPMV